MLPKFRKMSLTDFRKDASAQVQWVHFHGGHVWLTRHGKLKVGVVPFYEMEMLERVLSWDIDNHKAELEREYTRWKAAKAIQAAEHKRRLSEGWDNRWRRNLDDR